MRPWPYRVNIAGPPARDIRLVGQMAGELSRRVGACVPRVRIGRMDRFLADVFSALIRYISSACACSITASMGCWISLTTHCYGMVHRARRCVAGGSRCLSCSSCVDPMGCICFRCSAHPCCPFSWNISISVACFTPQEGVSGGGGSMPVPRASREVFLVGPLHPSLQARKLSAPR
jgi:hypothetical protein